MTDNFDGDFVTDTLQRGVSDLATPLDTLATGSIAAGSRIRRRRTAVAVLGGAGCVLALSAVTYGATRLGGDPVQVPGSSSAFAGAPASTTSATPTVAPDTTPGVPVHLVLDGWTCEEFAIDDKSWCTGPDGVNASVNWRSAADFDAWHGGDSDKTADWVGELHGKWFATVSLTKRDGRLAAQLGKSLVWE